MFAELFTNDISPKLRVALFLGIALYSFFIVVQSTAAIFSYEVEREFGFLRPFIHSAVNFVSLKKFVCEGLSSDDAREPGDGFHMTTHRLEATTTYSFKRSKGTDILFSRKIKP